MIDGITKVLPTEGLLATYLTYTDVGEVCPRFRAFAFLAAVGSIVKRKVFFQRSSKNFFPTIYPNPWVILVAPQGQGHKSTALSQALKLIKDLPTELFPKLLAAKLTPEALIKALASEEITAEMLKGVKPERMKLLRRPAQGLLYGSELGVLLGKEKYNQGMIALLTDLYDCADEWHSETVMRGNQYLHEVCLSIMGASTPDWMQSMLPQDAFKGGFMSRFILIGFPQAWHKKVADPPAPDEELRRQLLIGLEAVARLEGQMIWTPEAKAFFLKWYEDLPERQPGPAAAYLERKQDNLLRLATLYELCASQSLTLQLSSLQGALALMDAVEPETLKMIEYISIEPRMRVVQRVLEHIEAKEKVSEAVLIGEVWGYLSSPREFAEVIDMLLKAKKIRILPSTGGITYART